MNRRYKTRNWDGGKTASFQLLPPFPRVAVVSFVSRVVVRCVVAKAGMALLGETATYHPHRTFFENRERTINQCVTFGYLQPGRVRYMRAFAWRLRHLPSKRRRLVEQRRGRALRAEKYQIVEWERLFFSTYFITHTICPLRKNIHIARDPRLNNCLLKTRLHAHHQFTRPSRASRRDVNPKPRDPRQTVVTTPFVSEGRETMARSIGALEQQQRSHRLLQI